MKNRWQKAVKMLMAGAVFLWAGILAGQEAFTPENYLEMAATPSGSLSSSQEAGVQKVVYVVQTGDTLWDIAKRFLNSPYYWPKVWERNSFIINPHRIYPGDVLNLYPSSEKLSPMGEAALFAPESPGEIDVPDISMAVEEDTNKVVYKGIWSAGYLDVDEVQTAGSIMSNPDNKSLLGSSDKVYVNVGSSMGVKTGDIFSIFRITAKVAHPVNTGRTVGYRVINLGELKIGEQVKENVAEAIIINSYREIHDGDRIAPYTPPLSMEVPITPNQVALEGYIVANKNDTVAFGKDEIVYIDLGQQDGVQRGNVFEVYLQGEKKSDSSTGMTSTLPDRVIGKLLVLDPRTSSSVALATASSREFATGERIRMVSP